MSLVGNKPKAGVGIAGLLREAGRKAKAEADLRSNPIVERAVDQLLESADPAISIPVTDTRRRPTKPRIFSVIDYIEQPWGLDRKLFPAQRFIVKLYYGLELEDKKPTIKITDDKNTVTRFTLTEKEYLKFLYDEGRCNFGTQDHERRQLILSIGRRGGKCIDGGTLVLTSRGLLPIEQLGDPDGPEYQPMEIGVAQEGSCRSRSAYFYVGGVKPTIRFRTHCGYGVTGTANHRVRVMVEGGTIEWRRLDEIREGDMIAVHRGTDLWPTEEVDARPFHNEMGRKETWFPDTINESWGLLLGLLAGDGSWTCPTGVAMTVGYAEAWGVYKDVFTEMFGGYRVQPDKRTLNTSRLEYPGVATRRFLHDLGWSMEATSETKRVPWVIMRSPRPVVCAFLRGLFDTDGGIENRRRVTMSSASLGLVRDVQTLLLNLGILSRVKVKHNAAFDKDYYHLALVGVRSRSLFAEHIGFLTDHKNKPLMECVAAHTDEGKSDTESVPHQHEWIRRLLESVPKNQANATTGPLGWRRSLLRSALGNACKPGASEGLTYTRIRKAVAIAREVGAEEALIRHFEEILTADYFFDPVMSIEHGSARVYDLNVPDGESFVANGLTNHNTTLSSLFASYEVYRLLNMGDPHEYYGLPAGNTIQIVSVATDKEQAGILFREVSAHLAHCDYFKPYILSNNLSRVDFQTPSDIEKFGTQLRQEDGRYAAINGKASIRVTFKSAIAKSLRGMGNIVVILDEMAHFIDDGSTSADAVYKAVTPSMAAFSAKSPDDNMPCGPVESRLICISSPLNKQGKFYELYQTAMGGGKAAENMIAIQAPTWEVNPTVPTEYYQQKFHEDPNTFMVEHGAQFSDRVKGWIERPEDLLACVDLDLRPKDRGIPRSPYQMGVDVAIKNDGTAVAITHVEYDTIVLDYHEIWYAGVDWREANPHLGDAYPTPYARRLKEEERLDFEEIALWIDTLCKRFHITSGMFDRWEGLSLEQQLHKRGLRQFTSEFFNKDLSSKMYQAAKLLMFDQKLRLYDHPVTTTGDQASRGGSVIHSPLITELLTLQATMHSRNIIEVQAPQSGGKHDDMSDALVRSIWLSMPHIGKHGTSGMMNRPTVSRGTSLGAYQVARARMHGGFTQRVNPRTLVRRGR